MNTTEQSTPVVAKLPFLATFFALFGIGDTTYLTYHHYTAEPVPCSILSGCEQVLTSQWATLGGFLPASVDFPLLAAVPLAGIGLIGYSIAFVFAVLSLRGNRKTWLVFGLHVTMMAVFSGWLFYLQGVVIEAFCQFCLLSALTSVSMFVIALVSKFWRLR
ncbi:MAG: vitamin K epoxide reductase family protein [Acidobacteria bacterium]|nr:vitamin K epoxide reductase family protein [Acidobacteriota bacterium]